MRKLLKNILLLLALAPIANAVSAETLRLTTNPFQEDVLPSARISGSMVMGVQQQGRGSGVIDLKAFVPAAWAGETLCMRVVSSNGLYEAANEYSVPLAWQGGVAALPYPTRYEDRLGQMVQNELGARLQLGECSSKNVEATVVSWNDGARKARSLLLNSFQAEAVFVYIEGQARPIRCDPITLEGRTAFDTSCTMQVVDTDRPTEIEILRIVDGNAAPSTKVRVWLNAL